MENCYTGCREKAHMIRCTKCGEEYHIGLYHSCSTGRNRPKVIILDDNPFSIACYLEEYGDKLQSNESQKSSAEVKQA